MNILKSLWRIYSLIRYWFRGVLPPRRKSFRVCGERVFVHHRVRFSNVEDIALGDDIYIGPGCQIFGHGGLEICDGTVLGANVTIIASNHRFEGQHLSMLPFDDDSGRTGVKVAEGAWIGQNTIILPGVVIGKHSVVAAGSVVTRDTSPGSISGGTPAREIRKRDLPPGYYDLPYWAAYKSKRFHLY